MGDSKHVSEMSGTGVASSTTSRPAYEMPAGGAGNTRAELSPDATGVSGIGRSVSGSTAVEAPSVSSGGNVVSPISALSDGHSGQTGVNPAARKLVGESLPRNPDGKFVHMKARERKLIDVKVLRSTN
jgi:hypothetical protein